MACLESCSHTGTWVAASIQHVAAVVVFRLVEQRLDTGLHKTPRAGVERLFLRPDDGLGVGIRVEVLLELSPWEWVELLDAGNGRVGDLVLLAVFVKGGVDLTSAYNDTLDLVVWCNLEILGLVRLVWDDPLEV